MKINLVTLCSGIEAQGQAMRRLCQDHPELEWELLAWSDIDKDAIKAHNAIFPEYSDRNLGDMTKADYSKITEAVDCLIYSIPCTSVSVAGQNKGMKEGDNTPTALIWHTSRAIEALKPKVCFLENVKGMTMGKNLREFHKWQRIMESYGYANFCAILDAQDYGVPQHRERLFMVSILDCDKPYQFPKPFKLEKRIKDILEPYGTVDESYYFTAKQLYSIINHCERKVEEGCGFKTQFHLEDEVSGCIVAKYGSRQTDPYIKEGVSIHPLCRKREFQGYKSIKSDVAPCLTAHDGKSGEPVLWQEVPKILTSVRSEKAKFLRRMGIEKFANRELKPREDGISNTVTTFYKDNLLIEPSMRQNRIMSKVMPNGNIRFYQDDKSKSGISELQITHPNNECPTITTAHVPKILEPIIMQRPHGWNQGRCISQISPTITTARWETNNLLMESCILGYTRSADGKDITYHNKDITNTVHTSTDSGGNTDQYVTGPIAVAQRGRNSENTSDRATVQKDSMVAEPMESSLCNLPDKTVLSDEDGRGYLWQDNALWRIRKLTHLEVGRLMGVSDEDTQKMIDSGISKSGIYKLFGNSIVVDVLVYLFKRLWVDTENDSEQKSLFDI